MSLEHAPVTSAPPPLAPSNIVQMVADDLAAVEAELARYGRTGHAAVDEIYGHLLSVRGKRLRPLLLLLATRACGVTSATAIRLAAVVESIHTATLVHDDIIDAADTRRGIASVNARWSNSVAVLMGDWLYVDSFAQAVRERDFAVLDVLTALTRGLLEGELAQLMRAGDPTLAANTLIELAAGKTGHLFAGCTELGAIAASGSREVRSALHRYGMALGIAFQVVDDLLDLTGTDAQLGKPAMADVREGHVTLAVAYARERCSDDEREMIDRLYRTRTLDPGEGEVLQAILARTGSIDRAKEVAAAHAATACAHLTILPPSRYRDALLSIATLTVERTR